MERVRIVVAFGDIAGYGEWMIRASSALEEIEALINDVYNQLESCENHERREIRFKYLGDGFMAVLELYQGHNCNRVANFLRTMYALTRLINTTIAGSIWPRPAGFRLRVAAGRVFRRSQKACPAGGKCLQPEHIGYCVNLAERLLAISPQIEAICTQDVKEILGNKPYGIKMEKVSTPRTSQHGIDKEDLKGLWSFRIEDLGREPGDEIRSRRAFKKVG